MEMTKLFDAIKADYLRFMTNGGKRELSAHTQGMVDSFNKGIGVREGQKYIKIVKEKDSQAESVWGFIVNVHNDPKFKYGDILKAAGYNSPAKNKARGSIFDENFDWVKWTSAI